ncbi:Dephospho-CoA kinase [Alkalibacterium sp. AK22]|uniref:dephospho-CoA kinase n=1 Tax=Alkalibacterium sp. AK22 TaxID=1229520 RepID=UPI0004525527|nr:dephospho-CoA kinase [Alkalibacterium sp. AK22]EXJ22902.1 Dephospho-CoA kinase [Alkalibacterium sp. AK22]
MTYVLGLTGGIATGKSTVSRFFQQKGIPLVDADRGAREVMQPGCSAYLKTVDQFGEEILNKDRTLNRKALGAIVFSNKKKLDKLNAIVQADIFEWILGQMHEHIAAGAPLVVLDIPLLYEAGYEEIVDGVMVVWTDKDCQLKRLMNRDGLSREEAAGRIAAQAPLNEKIQKADVLIDNNGTIDSTQRQVESWLTENGY